jgi:hypothetical protein
LATANATGFESGQHSTGAAACPLGEIAHRRARAPRIPMKLLRVTKSSAEGDRPWARLAADVRMASGETFEIFYEVPAQLESALSASGNPWIVAMLPYALSTGEDVECSLPVDARLLENLEGLLATWIDWYPQFRRPRLIAPRQPFAADDGFESRTAVFFSGGIDSWFSVLRHVPEREPAAIGSVDDLVSVHGFDIPLEQPQEFAMLEATLSEGARALGRTLVVVRTNLRRRDTLWARAWGWLTHGAGLASVALVLEKRYGRAVIGSTHPYGGLIPWGSHPMTDGLFSTRHLDIRHDGAQYARTDKTALVARHEVALAHLHVCWKDAAAHNCGTCAKCLRTMATLELLGALEKVNPFPTRIEAPALAGLYLENDNEVEFFDEVRKLAAARGNRPIEQAIETAMRRSRRWRPFIDAADRMRRLPLLWRLAPAMRGWCAGARAGPR